MLPHADESTSVPSAREQSERVAFRRGLTYLAMTLVMPGSVQLMAGGRGLGRLALRVWASVWAFVLLFIALALLARNFVIGLYASAWFQWLLTGFFLVAGIGWALLFLDSWRLSRMYTMGSPRKWWMSAVSLVLALVVGTGGVQASAMARSQAELFGTVLAGGGRSKAHDGRINVLILGADADTNRDGIRTDTMIVASVDAVSGRTVLFSLPRNLQGAPLPVGPLRDLYPNGYRCPDESCLLNAVYRLGTEHPEAFPDADDPGLAALQGTVEETLGLQINYYAMVDLRGFMALIDALGGIRLDIARPVPIGGGTSKVSGYIQPGKNVHLNGYNALWFARSREGSSDYERMARQRCVINAVARQVEPLTIVTQFNAIASASGKIVRTNVPSGDVGGLVELAEKGRRLPIGSTSFAPPLIKPAVPDFSLIRATVKGAIAHAEDLDRTGTTASTVTPTATPTPTPRTTAGAKGTPSGAPKPVVAKSAPKVTTSIDTRPQADDLTEICGLPG